MWTCSFATDISLVNFDNPAKLPAELRIVPHGKPNPMRHIPSSLVRADLQIPLKLKGGYPFLRRTNQIDGKEPLHQRKVRVMKNSADGYGVLIPAVYALIQEPFFAGFPLGLKLHDPLLVALGAGQPFRPTDAL